MSLRKESFCGRVGRDPFFPLLGMAPTGEQREACCWYGQEWRWRWGESRCYRRSRTKLAEVMCSYECKGKMFRSFGKAFYHREPSKMLTAPSGINSRKHKLSCPFLPPFLMSPFCVTKWLVRPKIKT